jgi:hypothetical protein
MQSSSNSGAAGSSGEMGAVGALSSNLSSNIAANIGRLQSAGNISLFAQEDANARSGIADAQQLAQFGQTIFQTASLFDSSLFTSGKWNGTDFTGTKK